MSKSMTQKVVGILEQTEQSSPMSKSLLSSKKKNKKLVTKVVAKQVIP